MDPDSITSATLRLFQVPLLDSLHGGSQQVCYVVLKSILYIYTVRVSLL